MTPPSSVLGPLGDFCREKFGHRAAPWEEEEEEEEDEGRDFLRLADPAMPLLSLIYADTSLLTTLLQLLLTPPPPPSLGGSADDKAPAKGATAPSSLTLELFSNFVHYLDMHCIEHSCFVRPIISALSLQPEETPISKTFVTLVGKITLEFERQGDSEHLLRFVRDGGARLVFECLIGTCHHLQPCVETPLAESIAKLGNKDSPQPFKEGSPLVNFLPLASIKVSPNRTSARDLQTNAQSAQPSRTSTFHHSFRPNETWLTLSITLPYPILLHIVQLYQPLGLVQNGPSAVLLDYSRQRGSAVSVTVAPPLETSGLSCLRIELRRPLVVQEVILRLRRPLLADSISLSHLHLLGLGYGAHPGEGGRAYGPGADKSHPR